MAEIMLYTICIPIPYVNWTTYKHQISILILLNKATSQKLVLAPGAIFRGNIVDHIHKVFVPSSCERVCNGLRGGWKVGCCQNVIKLGAIHDCSLAKCTKNIKRSHHWREHFKKKQLKKSICNRWRQSTLTFQDMIKITTSTTAKVT